ncbi:hypothetical protein A6X21_05030 [Planctopirus hydrillae]|uniref:Transposase n=1 Tax=Planctopirus hydrillae TaxID=1841610 RepID=A0A1C3EIS1_9PLAN|nr:hypothetical protein A6X21_05030 [Planctopirus hydrillae]
MVKGVPVRPRQRPRKLYADAGYDGEAAGKELESRDITPGIRKRNTETWNWVGEDPPVIQWIGVVERTNSWLGGLRRFGIRYDRHQTIIDAWNHLAIAALCHGVPIRQAA